MYKNSLVVPNTIINTMHNTDKDCSKYSCIFTLYRNIHYSQKDGCVFAKLDGPMKDNMRNCMGELKSMIRQNNWFDDVYVISRKYLQAAGKTDTLGVKRNCFDLCCKIQMKEPSSRRTLTDSVDKVGVNSNVANTTSIPQRRQFAYALKQEIHSKSDRQQTMYVKSVLSRSIFLDVEFANDIIDDFKTFPVSKDMSMVFMAGVGVSMGGKFDYTNITVNQLSPTEEYKLMEQLIGLFEHFIALHGEAFVFHWSHVDVTVINKALSRYPCLSTRFNNIIGTKLHFVDLMKVFKSSSVLDSYSLKKVAKVMLNYEYDSECKNGFDAMMATIEYFVDKKNNLSDIIHYNKIDTMLLYALIREGLQFH